jgi:hypothetical protein
MRRNFLFCCIANLWSCVLTDADPITGGSSSDSGQASELSGGGSSSGQAGDHSTTQPNPESSGGQAETVGDTAEAGSSDSGGCTPESEGLDCSVICQDCPGSQKCGPFDGGSLGEPLCMRRPLEEDGLGEPCEILVDGDSCEAGSFCAGNGPDTGICIEICYPPTGSLNCTSMSTRCVDWTDPLEIYGVCAEICNPLEASSCSPGDTCKPYHPACNLYLDADCFPLDELGTFACGPVSSPPDLPETGEPCGSERECALTFEFCAPAGAVPGCSSDFGCCTPYCDLSGVDPDVPCGPLGAGVMCSPAFSPATAPDGLEGLGACLLAG